VHQFGWSDDRDSVDGFQRQEIVVPGDEVVHPAGQGAVQVLTVVLVAAWRCLADGLNPVREGADGVDDAGEAGGVGPLASDQPNDSGLGG
jgi:hypothetical protein